MVIIFLKASAYLYTSTLQRTQLTLVPVKERLKVSFILEPELGRVTVDFVFALLVFVHLRVRSVFFPFSFVPD